MSRSERRRRQSALSILPFGIPSVSSLESLDEISGWLGTFKERLRLARESERAEYATILNRLEARYRERRAELS
jgi:hypothetical protein